MTSQTQWTDATQGGAGDITMTTGGGGPPVDEESGCQSATVPPRRRAVDASDLRQCALVQTKMKTWKTAVGAGAG